MAQAAWFVRAGGTSPWHFSRVKWQTSNDEKVRKINDRKLT